MAAYENVQVTAKCPACNGSGLQPAWGVHRNCSTCKKTGRFSVPVSEWAAALATVEGVEVVEVIRFCGSKRWRVLTGEELSDDYEDREALVLPASASTREDGGR